MKAAAYRDKHSRRTAPADTLVGDRVGAPPCKTARSPASTRVDRGPHGWGTPHSVRSALQPGQRQCKQRLTAHPTDGALSRSARQSAATPQIPGRCGRARFGAASRRLLPGRGSALRARLASTAALRVGESPGPARLQRDGVPRPGRGATMVSAARAGRNGEGQRRRDSRPGPDKAADRGEAAPSCARREVKKGLLTILSDLWRRCQQLQHSFPAPIWE